MVFIQRVSELSNCINIYLIFKRISIQILVSIGLKIMDNRDFLTEGLILKTHTHNLTIKRVLLNNSKLLFVVPSVGRCKWFRIVLGGLPSCVILVARLLNKRFKLYISVLKPQRYVFEQQNAFFCASCGNECN